MYAQHGSTNESRSRAKHRRALSNGVMRPDRFFLRAGLAVTGTLALPVLAVWLVAGEVPVTGIVVSGFLLSVVVVLMPPTTGRS